MKLSLQYTVLSFLIVLTDIHLTSSLGNKVKCQQEGYCKCTYPNGHVIDLSNLASYKFEPVVVDKDTKIYFIVCQDEIVLDYKGNTECGNGCSLALINNATQTVKNLGKKEDAKFSPGYYNEDLKLQFQATDTCTDVLLNCTETLKPQLTFINYLKEENKYNLMLSSSEICKVKMDETDDGARLSVGSVLILMLISFLIVYFGGGVLTLKFLRGAEGKEMIPNYEFWADLPYLVRDGIIFTFNGFQTSPSYDRI